METKNFRRDILKAMYDRNIGLRELARQAGIDASFLSRILRGVREPPSEELIGNIAKTLGLDPLKLTIQAGRAPDEIIRALEKDGLSDYLKTIAQMTQKDWKELSKVIERHLRRTSKGA